MPKKRTFFAPLANIDEDAGIIIFGEKEAWHISAVLRLKEGDCCRVFDGSGFFYESRIISLKPVVKAEISGKYPAGSDAFFFLTVAIALPRKKKFEFLIEKSVELGVNLVVPLKTDRVVRRIFSGRKEDYLLERWREIALSAAKQSGSGLISEIVNPVKIENFFEKDASNYDLILLPHPYSDTSLSALPQVLSPFYAKKNPKIAVLVGPEGGFSEKEVAMAEDSGAFLFNMGKNILKTDTAAIAVISILKFLLENKL